jgi:uncharacterized protein YxeA
MKKEVLIGITLSIFLVIAGVYLYFNNPEKEVLDVSANPVMKIETQNIKVSVTKAQISNMDNAQIDAELEKLNIDESSDLEVDEIQ